METRVKSADGPRAAAIGQKKLTTSPRGWIAPAPGSSSKPLATWVGDEEERHRLTLEGMADVTAGRVVDQADVEAWAMSLATANPLPVPRR